MRLLFTMLMFVVTTATTHAQHAGDKILGRYQNDENTRKIEVYKVDAFYWGKLVWINEPDAKVETGTVVLKKIKYTGKDWTGYIYLPARNKTLDGTFTLDKNNNLQITANAGFMSKTKIWKRIN